MLSAARYGTSDLERAKKFYDEIASLLGARRVFAGPIRMAFMARIFAIWTAISWWFRASARPMRRSTSPHWGDSPPHA